MNPGESKYAANLQVFVPFVFHLCSSPDQEPNWIQYAVNFPAVGRLTIPVRKIEISFIIPE